jgi:UDPglucose 6-dehydrogenase
LNVAVLGLTFKPGTDDLREAPTLVNIPFMLEDGAHVKAWDPVGVKNFKKLHPDDVTYCDTIEETIKDADVCFIFTEWDEVKTFDLTKYAELMKTPIVLDGRNCYRLKDAARAKVIYDSVGRETVNIPENIND